MEHTDRKVAPVAGGNLRLGKPLPITRNSSNFLGLTKKQDWRVASFCKLHGRLSQSECHLKENGCQRKRRVLSGHCLVNCSRGNVSDPSESKGFGEATLHAVFVAPCSHHAIQRAGACCSLGFGEVELQVKHEWVAVHCACPLPPRNQPVKT